jgi:hypothetical protein
VVRLIAGLISIGAVSGILFVLTREGSERRQQLAAYAGAAGGLLLIGGMWLLSKLAS